MAMVFTFKCHSMQEKREMRERKKKIMGKEKSEQLDKRRNANTARANVQLCPPTISDYFQYCKICTKPFSM